MTRCPVCQHSFEPAQVPGGMCPACLLAGGDGVDGDDFLEEEVPRMVDWTPLGLDGMQALLPGYDWLAFIGRGGMGAVYKARQTALDRLVAIKVLPAAGGGNSGFFTDRFRNEARLLARMSHPGIVHVYDFGTLPDGSSFIVMEFVDGTDVARMVSATGRLPPEHAASITADVCAALHYAHGAGIVHRDIKPANILVNPQGQVKVADFGLAKARHGVLDGITQTGFMMGTPEFLAPESLTAGMVVDHRADLYAVGVMLYNMLTGQIPRGVFPPASRSSQSPPAFDGIISKAMQADPERRYQTAAAIKKDLDIARSAPASKEGKIRRGPLLFVGLVCLLTGTGVWHFEGFGPSRASDKTRTDPVSAMQTSSTNPTLRKASSGMVAREESGVDFGKYFQKLKESNPDCELLEKGSLDSEGALRITDGEGMLFLRLNGLAQLKNLNCLRPMGITHLDLRGTGVVDFRPILTSSLRLLYFTNGPGIDTDLLSLSQLEEVMVEGDYPFNLEHVVSPVLKYLDLNKVPLDSLEPLARCPSLRDLYLASAPVRDLRPLQGLPLQTLSLENTLVDNLEALRGMKNLQELRIHGSLIPDFSPLLDLPKLRVLRVDGSAHEGAGLREFLLKWAAQGKVKGQ